MSETTTLEKPSPQVETYQHPPEYTCVVLGAYVSAQARAITQSTATPRETFSLDSLSRLSGAELRQLREKIAHFWTVDRAKVLSSDFVDNNRVGGHFADIDSPYVRVAIAEIARGGVDHNLDYEYKQRIQDFRGKCRAKINNPETPREKIPELEELRLKYTHEARRTTVELTAFNGRVREFFDSDWARQNDLGRRHMYQMLTIAMLGDKSKAAQIEAGISTEIALHRAIDEVITHPNEYAEHGTFRYGSPEEDAKGGDIIYEAGGKTFYIDSKSNNPNGYSLSAGFLVEPAAHKSQEYDYKMYVWPSSYDSLGHQAIGNDFSILDPSFKAKITEMIEEANELSVVGNLPSKS